MPSRMIRDGILESEAVLSLPVEARWLYVSVLLSADDVGLFDATPFRLARRADLRREMADRLVQMLVDVDLIRLYEVSGKRYGFIPKFGQRLQLRRMRHPAPPLALMAGDDDAIKKINDLASKSTVNHGSSPMGSSDSPPESESEAEKQIGGVESNSKVAADRCVAPRKRSAPATGTRGTRLPQDWQLPKSLGDWSVAELGMSPAAVRAEAAKFRDYWHAKAGKDATKADWSATWRVWCRKAIEQQPASRPASRPAAAPAKTDAERNAEVRRLLGLDAMGLDVIEGDGHAR